MKGFTLKLASTTSYYDWVILNKQGEIVAFAITNKDETYVERADGSIYYGSSIKDAIENMVVSTGMKA